MKVVISSKSLYEELKKIDFDNESVESVKFIEDNMIIFTQISCVILWIENKEKISFNQHNARWDWVKKLLSQVDEQPIVINVNENKVSVIFEY